MGDHVEQRGGRFHFRDSGDRSYLHGRLYRASAVEDQKERRMKHRLAVKKLRKSIVERSKNGYTVIIDSYANVLWEGMAGKC